MSKTLLSLTALLVIASCSRELPQPPQAAQQPTNAGSRQCASCHSPEFEQWSGSHHQLAMQAAGSESVLGDFSDVMLPYFDTDATFSKRDGKFYVTTENGDGNKQEFEITHTFGVTPLQQYLVDAPGGRKQALQFAWDSRSQNDGGQRWYHLYPDEYIGPDDPLHWTGRYFNWNYMCAECHSTSLSLGYRIDTNSFDTTYSEFSVGCEACHGPGSRHIVQAQAETFDETAGFPVDLDDRAGATWIMNRDTGIAERSKTNTNQQQSEACGRCHSRRSLIAADYVHGQPLTDTHMPSLLEENLYFADGRIQDEVYVYGSFLQSKMYAAGVTCSDCHNPHSGELHAGPEPNNTCATCHLPGVFAATEHARDSVGDCVSCHMPSTTYMGVDDRRDHSFRLPGTADDPDHYGAAIAAGRAGNANDKLIQGIANESFPPIARSTMLTLLEPIDDPEDQATLLRQLDDPDPLVRIGALRALRRQAPEIRMQRGSHLLRDPIRSVRIEAALTYLEFRDLLAIEDSRAFSAAADEYRSTLTASAAMPDAAIRLADFEERLGNSGAAAKMLEHAIRVGDDSAPVQHAYGLFLVRSGKPDDAINHLRTAVELEPDASRFTYVYGVALNSLGYQDEAILTLSTAQRRFPGDFDIGWALATIYRDIGANDSAREILNRLEAQFPDNGQVRALRQSLEQR